MQVHFLTQCASSFAGVDKFPCQFVAKNDIIGASTPFLFRAHISKINRETSGEERRRKKNVGTWNTRIVQVINSQFLPIVSHPKQIQTCSPVAAHFDGSNRMCMIQSIPRCRRALSNVSPLRLWWHKWMQFRDNLWREREMNNLEDSQE